MSSGNVKEGRAYVPFYPLPITSPWRWSQQCPPKSWYPTTTLHGVITHNAST